MAAEKITITHDDILNGGEYLPLTAKENLTRGIAMFCVEPVVIKDGDSILPDMYRENRKLRQQFQMGILAYMLGREFPLQSVKIKNGAGTEEKQLAWCMDEDEYNAWASSHVMNQLERLKKAKGEDTDRIFDILYEYKAVEIMLAGAIRDELEQRNDVFNRAVQYLSVAAVESAMDKLADIAVRDVKG